MAFVRKRRVWWEPVPGVKDYVVYVSKDKTVFNPPKFRGDTTEGVISISVTEKAELVIPDDWPEFPTEQGTYYIGITSRDEVGNQSDPFLSEGIFKFTPPPPPSKGGIESL